MIYPTLYKRTKTGAIQFWRVESRELTFSCIVRKYSGQLCTDSPLEHKETISEGKQGRSPMQQADFQANSDWKRKHDDGYKSQQDLGITRIGDGTENTWSLYEGVSTGTLKEMLEIALPKFNTDANGNTKPMLATDYTKIKKIEFPCIIEPKFDGVRCLMILDPEATGIVFLSRTGKEYTTLDHIGNHVLDFMTNHPDVETMERIILDGEIFSDELTFQEIVSAVKAFKPASLKLHFRAYDMVSNDTQKLRKLKLGDLVQDIDSEYIQYVEHRLCHDLEEVKQIHDEFVQAGHEGAILRYVGGKYAEGQRSRELLKVKQFNSEEFAFKNFEFGQRGVEDLIAVCRTKDGKSEFRAKMVGTVAEKQSLWDDNENDEHEGISLTVRFFGYTEGGAGIPRFPIGVAFRSYE